MLDFYGEASQRVRNDFALTVFDESVRHAIEKRVLACQSVKGKKISCHKVSRRRIAQIAGDGQHSLIQLFSQCAPRKLVRGGDYDQTQN